MTIILMILILRQRRRRSISASRSIGDWRRSIDASRSIGAGGLAEEDGDAAEGLGSVD